jgi:Concanavalin A-like lectin/glucanases superfamily/Domain of unknown function (DUF2341)/Carboxypeptidase regulatory-like domain
MNKNRSIRSIPVCLLLCAGVCLYIRCTTNVAGSVTEGGNVEIASVTGTVVDAAGNDVAGAQVELRPSDFLKDTSGKAPSRNIAANAVSDTKGNFKIDSIDPGDYCISAARGDSLAVLVRISLLPGDTSLAPARLAPVARIEGTVINQYKILNATYVRVHGLDKIARVDSATGSFSLVAVPEGTYQLQIDVSSPLYKPVAIPNVACASGGNTDVDTIAIAPFYGEDYTQWQYSSTVKLNTTSSGAQVSGSVSGFPVLIRLRSPVFAFGQALADGRDLRFANSKGTHLPFEIERFDPNAQVADVWVLVDTVKGNDSTLLTMYWGNANAVVQSASGTVFDTSLGYVAVWHLNDRALNERRDATFNYYNASPAPGTYEGDEWTYGLIGGCDSLDDNDDHLVAPDINAGSALTVSMWVNMYELTSSLRQYFIGKAGSVAGKPPLYSLMLNSGNQLAMNVTVKGRPDSVSGGSLLLNSWYFVTGTYDGTTLKVYVNGILVNSKEVSGQIDTSTTNLYIGYFDRISQKLHGKIDEVRLLREAQSADWIKLCFENQKLNSTFVAFGN